MSVGDNLDQITMNKRFSSGEMDVANTIAGQDIEGELGLLKGHGVLLLSWQLVDREVAKRAAGVTDARNCEMAGAWTTIQ